MKYCHRDLLICAFFVIFDTHFLSIKQKKVITLFKVRPDRKIFYQSTKYNDPKNIFLSKSKIYSHKLIVAFYIIFIKLHYRLTYIYIQVGLTCQFILHKSFNLNKNIQLHEFISFNLHFLLCYVKPYNFNQQQKYIMTVQKLFQKIICSKSNILLFLSLKCQYFAI